MTSTQEFAQKSKHGAWEVQKELYVLTKKKSQQKVHKELHKNPNMELLEVHKDWEGMARKKSQWKVHKKLHKNLSIVLEKITRN